MLYYPYASSLCHDRYAECFEAYKRICTERACMRQWIHDNLLNSLPHQENISILSLGRGSGDFDLQLIELVASKFKSVDYVAVEPNKVHSQQFKIRTITYPLQGIRYQTLRGINQIRRKFLKRVKGIEKEMFSSKEIQSILH